MCGSLKAKTAKQPNKTNNEGTVNDGDDVMEM